MTVIGYGDVAGVIAAQLEWLPLLSIVASDIDTDGVPDLETGIGHPGNAGAFGHEVHLIRKAVPSLLCATGKKKKEGQSPCHGLFHRFHQL